MAYTTRADLERRFKAEEIAQLVSDEESLDNLIADASALIDAYLTPYQLPLAPPVIVPDLLGSLAADITRYRLWDDRAPAEVRKRYEDALALLRDIAKGLVKLPLPVADPTPLEAGGSIAFTTRERSFTDDTLGGFVARGELCWPPRTD